MLHAVRSGGGTDEVCVNKDKTFRPCVDTCVYVRTVR